MGSSPATSRRETREPFRTQRNRVEDDRRGTNGMGAVTSMVPVRKILRPPLQGQDPRKSPQRSFLGKKTQYSDYFLAHFCCSYADCAGYPKFSKFYPDYGEPAWKKIRKNTEKMDFYLNCS